MHVQSHSVEEILPVVGLARTVLYPGMQCTLLLANLKAFGAVREAQRSTGRPLVAVCGATSTRNTETSHVFGTGVLAEILDLSSHSSGLWLTQLQTQGRVSIGKLLRAEPFRLARVSPIHDDAEPEEDLVNLVYEIQLRLIELKRNAPCCTVATAALDALALADNTDARISSLMSCLHILPLTEQQDLLESPRRSQRLTAVLSALENRIQTYPRAAQVFV
jgi:ATP-dependent Lon protease